MNYTERRILVVEKDKTISAGLEEHLAEIGVGISLSSVSSTPEAPSFLQQTPTHIIICSHENNEQFDGLDLLRILKFSNPLVQVVLVADPACKEDQVEALQLGCTNFIVKPYSEAAFANLILSMLQPHQSFSGKLVAMRLEDVLQMLCYRKESTLLRVRDHARWGSIYVHDGGITHAEIDDLSGVEAFYEILSWESGEFLSQIVLTLPEQTLFMDWQSLLMEGMRQKDEIRHALGSGPRLGSVSVPVAGTGETTEISAKRIMIVDDSRFIRKIVQEILQSDPGITVAGYAVNGQEALSKIEDLRPDLILLDWDMPVMKGSTTLMHIMIRSPCPVVILSGFVGGVGANPFDLLCLGGIDFLRKPQNNWRIDGRANDLVHRIKEACKIKFDRIKRIKIPSPLKSSAKIAINSKPADSLIVMCSSTGACIELIKLITMLPVPTRAGVLVIHDMQQEAIGAFVDYLDRRSVIRVKPLEDGAPLLESTCYLHPASVPLEIRRENGNLFFEIVSDLPGKVADHFLSSASRVVGKRMVVVLLSGNDENGLAGLRSAKQIEAVIMAQEPDLTVNPSMINHAISLDLVDYRFTNENVIEMLEDVLSQT